MLFVITFLLLGIAFAGTCASASPFLNKSNEPCGICGKLPDEAECKEPKMNLN